MSPECADVVSTPTFSVRVVRPLHSSSSHTLQMHLAARALEGPGPRHDRRDHCFRSVMRKLPGQLAFLELVQLDDREARHKAFDE